VEANQLYDRRELIAKDVLGLVIWAVGYHAVKFRWQSAAVHFTDQTQTLLRLMLAEQRLRTGEILVVGLGGLVATQLIREADACAHMEPTVRNPVLVAFMVRVGHRPQVQEASKAEGLAH
jgi:hypothetical protein